MAAYGYEDELFESVVSKRLHCTICLNVFKDPVQCRRNQHLFCRGCITRHLARNNSCPVCKDELTVDTLSDPPRILTDCLDELKIRCIFFERGCSVHVELQDLERHAEECGYAPAFCSNEKCGLEVNKRELIHHECLACDERKLKCHNCERLSKDVAELKGALTAMNEKFGGLEKKFINFSKNMYSGVTTNLESFQKDLASKIENQQKNIDNTVRTLKKRNRLIQDGFKEIVEAIEMLHKKPKLQTDDHCAAYSPVSSDEDTPIADNSSCASSQGPQVLDET